MTEAGHLRSSSSATIIVISYDTQIMTLGSSIDLHSDIQALRHSESHTLRTSGSRLGHKYPNRLSGGTLDTP